MGGKQLPETLTLIRDNILQYDNPLAVSARENAEWAEKDLNLPKKGDILFYTGGEYQLLPFMGRSWLSWTSSIPARRFSAG